MTTIKLTETPQGWLATLFNADGQPIWQDSTPRGTAVLATRRAMAMKLGMDRATKNLLAAG